MTTAIDLFAGFGGFTAGAEKAGVDVLWAANHWPTAVEVHKLNHPEVDHACQDLRQADWSSLPRYDWLLASPACQGHSSASQPRRTKKHDADRSTAFAVVDCADVTEPDGLIVENVPAFRNWRLYPEWCGMLCKLGYHLQEHVLTASVHGRTPQRRPRLFIIGTRKPVQLDFKAHAELPFEPCIDWSAGGWRDVKAGTLNVQARIAKGRRNYGRRFLTQNVTDHPGVPLDEPIRTITCAPKHWALVDGNQYRYLTERELARGMGFPDSYRWPDHLDHKQVVQGLGNAVPPGLAATVIRTAVAA